MQGMNDTKLQPTIDNLFQAIAGAINQYYSTQVENKYVNSKTIHPEPDSNSVIANLQHKIAQITYKDQVPFLNWMLGYAKFLKIILENNSEIEHPINSNNINEKLTDFLWSIHILQFSPLNHHFQLLPVNGVPFFQKSFERNEWISLSKCEMSKCVLNKMRVFLLRDIFQNSNTRNDYAQIVNAIVSASQLSPLATNSLGEQNEQLKVELKNITDERDALAAENNRLRSEMQQHSERAEGLARQLENNNAGMPPERPSASGAETPAGPGAETSTASQAGSQAFSGHSHQTSSQSSQQSPESGPGFWQRILLGGHPHSDKVWKATQNN